jgi:uncharacterized protein (DUF2147 family)
MKCALLGLLWLFTVNASAQAPSVLGEWWTPGFNSRVRIEACGDAVCGRIVWLWDEVPKGIADKNPLVGRKVIESMVGPAAGPWTEGRLYNPEDGRHYKGSLSLRSPDQLVVNGCVLFICQTQIWRRVDNTRCPPVASMRGPDWQG